MTSVNAMSVDVEDYFHASAFDRTVARSDWDRCESRIAANTDRLLALFARANVRGTFFILGWVAERHPSLVRRIAMAGHEIASHGYGHRLVYEQAPAEFREDVRRAKSVIESIAARRVLGYRAPSYSITTRSLWAREILVEEGYTYDSSVFPIHHDRYGIAGAPRHVHTAATPAGPLIEVPPATVRCAGINLPIGGGGYFRLLPYRWTKWGIARLNTLEHQPAVFYLHPWELDAAQPQLAAPWTTRLRHYRNLAATAQKLAQLVQDFRFDAIAKVFGLDTQEAAAAS